MIPRQATAPEGYHDVVGHLRSHPVSPDINRTYDDYLQWMEVRSVVFPVFMQVTDILPVDIKKMIWDCVKVRL
jgi:hypothetical protein